MRNKSFTLIELLVVIVIIGVLAGVIIVTTTSSISKANITKLKIFEESVKNSLLLNAVSEYNFNTISIEEVPAIDGDVMDSWGSYNLQLGTHQPTTKGESECVDGKCLSFDGGTQYLIGNNKDFESVTVSLWVRPNVNSTQFTPDGWHYYARQGDFSYELGHWGGSNTSFKVYNQDSAHFSVATNSSLKANTWYFITATVYSEKFEDGKGEICIYINSAKEDCRQDFTGHLKSGTSIRIGGLWSTYGFDGLIDEVKLYDRALSFSQIKQNYIAGLNSLIGKGLISEEEYAKRIISLSSSN